MFVHVNGSSLSVLVNSTGIDIDGNITSIMREGKNLMPQTFEDCDGNTIVEGDAVIIRLSALDNYSDDLGLKYNRNFVFDGSYASGDSFARLTSDRMYSLSIPFNQVRKGSRPVSEPEPEPVLLGVDADGMEVYEGSEARIRLSRLSNDAGWSVPREQRNGMVVGVYNGGLEGGRYQLELENSGIVMLVRESSLRVGHAV